VVTIVSIVVTEEVIIAVPLNDLNSNLGFHFSEH